MSLTRADFVEMLYREGEKRALHRLWSWEGLTYEERVFFQYVARKVGLIEAQEFEPQGDKKGEGGVQAGQGAMGAEE